MGITVVTTSSAASACARLAQEAGAHGSAVWLVPGADAAMARRKALAAEGSALRLGCPVLPLSEWVADRWELFGDGRAIVTPAQRTLLMRRVLAEGEAFPLTPGTVGALCQMVQQGFGVPAFTAAVEGVLPDGCSLSDTERLMLNVAGEYARRLDERGMCERGSAMQALAACSSCAWPSVICEGFSTLSREEAAFFAALSSDVPVYFAVETAEGSRFDAGEALMQALLAAGALVKRADLREGAGARSSSAGELADLAAFLYYPDAQRPVQAGGAVRALLPAGRYAETALIASALDEAAKQACASVLVACNDPADMFERLAPRASLRGCRVEACYARAFSQTDFGAALLNGMDLVQNSAVDTFQASDFSLSALSDMGLLAAYAYDAKWRGNRLTSKDGVLDDVCDRAPEVAAPFVGSLENGRWEEALDVAEARYRALGDASGAFRAEQLAAVACARRAFAHAQQMGAGAQEARALLEEARVTVRVAVQEAEKGERGALAPCLHILSHAQAACSEVASFDWVLACNLNASEQPLRESRTSVDELFAELGADCPRNLLFEARLRMLQMIRAARHRVVLVRALHNEEADPAYPAVVFEDVVDCYRTRPADASELDKATSLPPALLPFAVQRGEELLSDNLAEGSFAACAAPAPLRSLEVGASDEASAEARSLVMLRPVLSPSAIEDYLDCPHKWFASRRLRVSEPDATFSAREKGSFIHAVLQRFYSRFACEYDTPKPTPATLPQAESLLEEVFAQQLAAQSQLRLSENPLVPLSETEHRQVDAMLLRLKGFLADDARLLPGFAPWRFELPFGGEVSFEYAGVPLVGTVDRIDVDGKGRAVVVDYKSSLSDRYFLLPAKAEGFELPAKVQTLIYAQVVRRLLGLDVVGALYVNTQRSASAQPRACGAYDDALFGSDDVLGASAKRNALSYAGFRSFHDLLDETERLIAERLEGLAAGDVSVRPRSDAACTFCPVLSCKGRL